MIEVAAALIRRDHKFLICQRPKTKACALLCEVDKKALGFSLERLGKGCMEAVACNLFFEKLKLL